MTLFACRTLQTFDTPLEPDYAWDRAAPSAEDQERFEAAWDYHQTENGLAMLVIQGDTIVFEAYANGHSASTPWHLYSGTKTFSCAMAAKGIEQGLLTLDEPVGDTLPEFQGTDLTVRHLLNFNSGLEQRWMDLTWDGLVVPEDQRVEDKYAYARTLPFTSEPGEVYEYGNQHLMIFGALMEAKLDQDPLPWLEQQVLDPIGLRTSGWHHDGAGNSMWPYGAWTTASEWARFGVLLRDDGVWEGQQVLPEGTFDACSTGSDANPAYGHGVWLNREGLFVGESQYGDPILSADAPDDLIAAAGAGGQRLYIAPSQDLVVVLQTDSRTFSDALYLGQLFAE